MYCTKCGTELSDDSRFCHKCGSAVSPAAYNDTVNKVEYTTPDPAPKIAAGAELPQQPSNADDGTYGILGFVLAFFVPIVGFILSIMGVNKKKNAGFAAAGVVISIILMVLSTVLVILIISGEIDFSTHYHY